jgi:hypothetical protein
MIRHVDSNKKKFFGVTSTYILHTAVTSAAFLGLVIFVTSHMSQVGHFSPEVGFADASHSGLAIVPASCPSAPILTDDSYGIRVPNGTAGETIGIRAPVAGNAAPGSDEEYCVTNYTGSDVYVPAKTQGEIDSFVNSIPTAPVGSFSPALYWVLPSAYH